MENVEMSVDGDTLVIKVNLKAKGSPSSSGKTVLIASTRGAEPLAGSKRGVKVALNVMAPR